MSEASLRGEETEKTLANECKGLKATPAPTPFATLYPFTPLARAFLRGDLQKLDPLLPAWLQVLTDVGAQECFHKKSTFKTHLFEVYKILKLWGQDEAVCRCGLFHSAYSNSYVNLAIFQSAHERKRLRALVGEEAEDLIHMFCIVPRHHLIYEALMGQGASTRSSNGGSHNGGGGGGAAQPPVTVPAEGVTVRHIHTGDPLHVDRRTIAAFLVMTMADFAEQLHNWQDRMFLNDPDLGGDGKLRYAGDNPGSLWPGDMKPGLWHAALSRMGRLLASCGPDLRAPLPPVFNACSATVSEPDQLAARDLYWQAVTQGQEPHQHHTAQLLLERAVQHNPHVAEPHLLLSQIHCQRRAWGPAAAHARAALDLLMAWGTCWDKRMSWEVWVSMARVLLGSAHGQSWPATPMGMLNLGLVPGLSSPY